MNGFETFMRIKSLWKITIFLAACGMIALVGWIIWKVLEFILVSVWIFVNGLGYYINVPEKLKNWLIK
jgi:hypothetical protein